MLELGQKMIFTITDDEAILVQISMLYKTGLVRVVPLNKKGQLRPDLAFVAEEKQLTPVL